MKNRKHIVAISALIKNETGDKFLIIKRNKDEIAYPGKWSFPGGKVEKGETITAALKREALEEVGLEIEDYKKFIRDHAFIRADGHNVVGFCFLVKAKSYKVKISEEFDDYRWVTPEEFKNYDYIKGMEEEIKIAF